MSGVGHLWAQTLSSSSSVSCMSRSSKDIGEMFSRGKYDGFTLRLCGDVNMFCVGGVGGGRDI